MSSRPGFSLLELLVAIAVSSIVAVALFQAYQQATQSLARVNGVSSTYTNMITSFARLEADLTGAIVPPYGDPDLAKKPTAEKAKKEAPQQQKDKQEKKEPDQDKQADNAVKKVFIYETENGQLKRLSFITRNPTHPYKEQIPCIVRVTYTLQKDPASPSEFILLRAQTAKLELDDSKEPGHPYVILRHIKKCSCKLQAIDIEELKKQQEERKKTKKEGKKLKKDPFKMPPMKTYEQWPPKEEKKDDKKTSVEPLPLLVKTSITYHDEYQDRDEEFTFLGVTPYSPPALPVQLITISASTQTGEQEKTGNAASANTQNSTEPKTSGSKTA